MGHPHSTVRANRQLDSQCRLATIYFLSRLY